LILHTQGQAQRMIRTMFTHDTVIGKSLTLSSNN